jgi:uncharacterized damage-inducible protein DinB
MTDTFPSCTIPRSSRADVFISYLEFFRNGIINRVDVLTESELRSSRLPSGWTPLELVKHLTFMERRWLEWGFEGVDVEDPWGDDRDGKWFVDESESRGELLDALRARGLKSEEVIRSNDLDTVGQPGPRWNGEPEPTLERILFHVMQEYARHLGHLDIVVEIAGGPVGE